MTYQTPTLKGPAKLYESPFLLNVEEVSGAGVCVTGGGCKPAQQNP